MKKTVVLVCGLMCVMFIAATASAKPPLRKGVRGLEQVGRQAPHHVTKRVMRHQQVRSSFARQSTRRAPTMISRPRIKGDVWGTNPTRRGTATRYTNSRAHRASNQAKRIAEARIQSRVNCVDGTNCGSIRANGSPGRSSSNRHNITSTLASPEERQRSYLRKVWQNYVDKNFMPKKLKELESGCNDYAACM